MLFYDTLSPYIISKMDERKVISALVTNHATGIQFDKFLTINTLQNGKTLVGTLNDIHTSICHNINDNGQNWDDLYTKYSHLNIARDTVLKILVPYIKNLLSDPAIDYTIDSNINVLAAAMSPLSFFAVADDMLDRILSHHKLNPDVVLDCNSVGKLLGMDNAKMYCNRMRIYLKHGANLNLNISVFDDRNQLYMITTQDLTILDIIVEHTEHFYCLEKLLGVFRSVTCLSRDAEKVFESILRCGKISSFKYLGRYKTNVDIFYTWLKEIRTSNHDIESMRTYFGVPIQHFNLVKSNTHVNDSLRNLILFRCNLECLTQCTVTVPAYRHYEIAIIMLFLIKNPHLTVITCDVLRYIVVLVFS